MVENPVYEGSHVLRSSGEVLRGDWEPVVSVELFRKANNRVGGLNSMAHPSHTSHPDLYPLKRVLLCPRCGDKFTASISKKRYPYYQCKGKNCLKRERIPVAEAHRQFEELLSESGSLDLLLESALSTVEAQARVEISDTYFRRKGLEQQVKGLEDKRQRYVEAYVFEKIGKSDFELQNNLLSNEIATLRAEISNLPRIDESFVEDAVQELRDLVSDPLQFWKDAPDELRPELAQVFFPERVICENKTLRTGNLLGLSGLMTSANDGTVLMAPPTGFEPVPPP